MPGKAREGNGSPTAAELRLDELFGQSKPWAGRRDWQPERLDVHADLHDPDQEIRASHLAQRLIDPPDEGGWRLFSRGGAQPPVIRIEDAVITGALDLRAGDLPFLLEFVRCRFDEPPDLRQAHIAGMVFHSCRLPGMRARNLTTANDVVVTTCTSTATITLTDAELGGSLELKDSELSSTEAEALHAERLSVKGALLAVRIRVSGELRIPGADIGGNLNLAGAELHNPDGTALNANGIRVNGSLRAGVDPNRGGTLTASGLIYLPSATVAGDVRMRGATLDPGNPRSHRDGSTYDDPVTTLILDRADVAGDVRLDEDFRSTGTIRMVSAKVGGDLRMAGADIDLSATSAPNAVERPPRAMHLDGLHVGGNLEASGLTLRGQLRMIDATVSGSFQLNNSLLVGPRTDTVQANRIQVGSNFACRTAEIIGSLQLQGAKIGANLDLRSVTLSKPAWHPHRRTYKSSLDVRASHIGRDLVCAEGSRAFSSEGELQLRRAVIGRQVNLYGCSLGEDNVINAINAFGLSTQEFVMRPAEPPRGRVLLRQARCELLDDNATLWAASGGVDVEDFTYDNFAEPVEPTDQTRVRERLEWLRTTSASSYQPGPYDQLATVFRENGNEEHAVTVLIEKQRRRYQAIAATSGRLLGLPVHLWSLLQRVTVNYGYRPMRALLWLVLFAAAGTAWFGSRKPLDPINAEDNPVWNPFLYTVDQLVPIVNLGHDVMWQAKGHSQWITVVLIAVGWILATTVAAGISRALRRER